MFETKAKVYSGTKVLAKRYLERQQHSSTAVAGANRVDVAGQNLSYFSYSCELIRKKVHGLCRFTNLPRSGSLRPQE